MWPKYSSYKYGSHQIHIKFMLIFDVKENFHTKSGIQNEHILIDKYSDVATVIHTLLIIPISTNFYNFLK